MKWPDSSQTELQEFPEEEEILWIDLVLFVKIEFAILDLPKKKALGLDHFISKFFQTFKEEKKIPPILLSLSEKLKRRKHYSEACNTLYLN